MKELLTKLEKECAKKFWEKRTEKINCQLQNLFCKQEQERQVLQDKLDHLLREQDKIRKREQTHMLNKFCNLQAQLDVNQRVEMARMNHDMRVKNFAAGVVGKLDGAEYKDYYRLKAHQA